LAKGNFPTVGLPLNKPFWLHPGKPFLPPCKNFFRSPWRQTRQKCSFRATYRKHFTLFLQSSQMQNNLNNFLAVRAEVDSLTTKHERFL